MYKIKKMDLMVSIYILCVVLSELMGAKTFPVANIFGFHLNASVAIFVIPIVFLINDVIAEVFGKDRARSLVSAGTVVIFSLVVYSFLATALPPSAHFASSEKAYDQIFSQSIRMSIASLIAFAVSDFLDVFIFVKMREKLGKSNLWLRTNVSNFISELVDSTIFIYLAFYVVGMSFGANSAFLIGMIVPYWLLRCAMSIIETPFVYLGVNWLRKGESKELLPKG